ncbi:MAG: CotH kinase family protein, partial [Lachnospiraceae bacterium]|nr:CotH kinase family protein [Lachnospiraceae bacterium]
MDRILALFLSLLLVLASGCEMLQGLVDTDPAAYSDPVGEETGQAGTERPSEPTRPSVTPADTGTETPSQETPTQEATEAPEPSSEETGDVTEAPGSEETPSETAVPETGETPPETETQAPGPTDVPGTLPEPWVIERDYTPASEANAIGTVAPGNLYEWADYGASVEYDSAVGTVSAYRDGNFYYLFLPPDTSGSVTFTLRGGIRAVSQGTFSGDRVTVPYHGPTYVSAALANGGNVHVILMQSSVPAMHIVLDNVTLETVHWDKNVKHGGNTVLLIDPENPANNIRATGVEFKGRGNSSWNHYEKKGYQVKFSGRTSVLGMEPAKKWCLVPSAGDGSLLRNKVAYELAKASGCFLFTPEAQFVDLWVSGEYRGLYLITEKVEIDKNRLPLSDPQGVLVELDDMFYFEDTYLQSPVSGHFYVMKEAVDETSLDGFYNFFARMTDLETKLVNHAPWETIAPMIDVQSFASLYIMLELMFNVEDLYTSFFFYMDGPSDVIHMGPVWDYDTCGGLYQEDWLGNKVQGYT